MLITLDALEGTDSALLAPGVYRAGFPHNFNIDLESAGYTVNEDAFFDRLRAAYRLRVGSRERRRALDAALQGPSDYGVCDHWEQIIGRWPEIVASDRRFVIGMTQVRGEDDPPGEGWRWSKWGEYIGEHEPQCEYLSDEPDIRVVWTWYIYEVLAGPGIEGSPGAEG